MESAKKRNRKRITQCRKNATLEQRRSRLGEMKTSRRRAREIENSYHEKRRLETEKERILKKGLNRPKFGQQKLKGMI